MPVVSTEIPDPRHNPELLAHDQAERILLDAWNSGRMPHAWLIGGVPGIGKATLAFRFARFLLSQGEEAGGLFGDPPPATSLRIGPEHPVFTRVASGGHADLLTIERPFDDKKGRLKMDIPVDQVRRIAPFLRLTAAEGGWRVVVLDGAERLNMNGQNAILKILEEPPARSLFLIVNHMPGRLLPTIRSRCRVLRLGELQASEIASRLRRDVPDASDDEIAQASAQAMGSMRTGFQNLIGGGGEVNAQVQRLFALTTPDWAGIQALADAVSAKGREASYGLMVRELFQALAAESEKALAGGDLRAAERLAAFWQSEDARWREGEAYNLDRKQMLLTFFTGLSAARND